MRMGYSVSAVDARGNVGLAFESRDKSKPFLFAINIKRELPPGDPQVWSRHAFRPYIVQPDDTTTYAIDWLASGKAAVAVTDLRLADRHLSLAFVAVEPKVGDILARELIRDLLLGGLLRDELHGSYDDVTYLALETNSSITEAVA